EVGQVVGLAAHANARILGLDEVAYVHPIGEHRARTQARERTNLHRALGARAVDVAMRAHFRAGSKVGIAGAAERADAHAVAKHDAALEHHVDVDLHVLPDVDLAADVDARRIGEARALRAQRAHLAQLERTFELRQLPRVVRAFGLDRALDHHD